MLDVVMQRPRGTVGGDAGARPNLRRPGCDRCRLHAGGRARGRVRRVRRLRCRGARRQHPHRCRHRRVAPQRPDARSASGLEAARAARAGAVLAPGRAAARRADQQSGHPFDPLARRRAQRLRRHHGHHQPRPAFPEPGVHAHRRPRFPAAQDLSRQLRRLHAGLGAGARARRGRECQGQGPDLGLAGVRAAILRQRLQGAPGDLAQASSWRRSRSRKSGPRRARIPTSASSRARSCIARRCRSRS